MTGRRRAVLIIATSSTEYEGCHTSAFPYRVLVAVVVVLCFGTTFSNCGEIWNRVPITMYIEGCVSPEYPLIPAGERRKVTSDLPPVPLYHPHCYAPMHETATRLIGRVWRLRRRKRNTLHELQGKGSAFHETIYHQVVSIRDIICYYQSQTFVNIPR